MNAESAVEITAAIADFFEWLCVRPFLHSNDSSVTLNVKDDARVRQKTVSAYGHQYLASDSSTMQLLQAFYG